MKILLLGFSKLKFMPYSNFYLNNLDKNKHEIHFLYWNRDNLQEEKSKDITYYHEFSLKQNDKTPFLTKVKNFQKYKKYAQELINEIAPDLIICLHTMPCYLLRKTLISNFPDKYIFDYRDVTYEKFHLFKKAIGQLIEKSMVTFTSSDAFRKYFPADCSKKIITSHNLLEESLNHRNDRENGYIHSDKIRIAFWGFIRHKEVNLEIIKKISMDDRFELHYYGREQETALALKEYVIQNTITNVFFHGEYKPEDRYNFIKSTDIIHNVYKDSNMMLAMGNKYYDGIIFKIPLLSFEKSFMGERSVKAGIGFECNPYDDKFTDKLYLQYISLRNDMFQSMCDIELSKILEEYYAGAEIIKEI